MRVSFKDLAFKNWARSRSGRSAGRTGVTLVLGIAMALMARAPGRAAAISCDAATSAVEGAICANPTLRTLDARMAKAYARVVKATGNTDRPGKADPLVLASQQDWLTERARCGADVACLETRYRARLATLSFQPDTAKLDSASPDPIDRFVGRYDSVDGAGAAIVLRLGPGRALMRLEAWDTTNLVLNDGPNWICFYSAEATVVDGALRSASPELAVSRPDPRKPFDFALRPEGPGRLATLDNGSAQWCGVDGRMPGHFAKAARGTLAESR